MSAFVYVLISVLILTFAVWGYLYYSRHYLHHKQQEFYSNGNVKRKYFLFNGVKDGQETIFYPTGEVNKTMIWQSGILTGPFIVFFKSGQKYISGDMENGAYVGVYEVYDTDGQVIMKREF